MHLLEGETVGHSGPMDRGDEVVDPEAPLQIDQPLGDFGGRADQETIVEQLVETVVESSPAGMTLSWPHSR